MQRHSRRHRPCMTPRTCCPRPGACRYVAAWVRVAAAVTGCDRLAAVVVAVGWAISSRPAHLSWHGVARDVVRGDVWARLEVDTTFSAADARRVRAPGSPRATGRARIVRGGHHCPVSARAGAARAVRLRFGTPDDEDPPSSRGRSCPGAAGTPFIRACSRSTVSSPRGWHAEGRRLLLQRPTASSCTASATTSTATRVQGALALTDRAQRLW